MTPAKNLRMVATADGRLGWPEIVVYQILTGPDAGKARPVPPTDGSHYLVHVLDREAYEELRGRGWIYDPRHGGCTGPSVDRRRTS